MNALFLDRDGVINERLPGHYVRYWSEFSFRPEVLAAISLFSNQYDYIFIVTNQQGIGKGLMDQNMLEIVHHQMIKEIQAVGGRINAIYFCPLLDVSEPFCRKPLPGMAYQAQRDFPDIDFRKATMVGDMHTDIRFGHHLGMRTVRVSGNEDAPTKLRHLQADITVDGLMDLATQPLPSSF